MGKDFTVIYKILKELDRNAGNEDFDLAMVGADRLGVAEARWEQIIIELAANGYIAGVSYTQTLEDKFPHLAHPITPRITLKGMEYLSENSAMKKAGRVISGVIDVVK